MARGSFALDLEPRVSGDSTENVCPAEELMTPEGRCRNSAYVDVLDVLMGCKDKAHLRRGVDGDQKARKSGEGPGAAEAESCFSLKSVPEFG